MYNELAISLKNHQMISNQLTLTCYYTFTHWDTDLTGIMDLYTCLKYNLVYFVIPPNGFMYYGNNFWISKLTRLHFKQVCKYVPYFLSQFSVAMAWKQNDLDPNTGSLQAPKIQSKVCTDIGLHFRGNKNDDEMAACKLYTYVIVLSLLSLFKIVLFCF